MTDASHGPLTYSTENRGRTTVVRLAGDIDMAAEQAMTSALAAAVAGRPSGIVVDLTGVGFLDSTGIRCLLVGKRAAATAGVSLTVRGAHGIVHQVLEVSGVLAALAAKD